MNNAPSLVEFLARQSPENLQSLKRIHSDSSNLFTTQRHLGREDNHISELKDRAAAIDLIRISIAPLISNLDILAGAVRRKMVKVARIRFSGAIVATVAGGLTGFLGLAAPNGTVQAVTSFIAMIGGAISVVADQFERAPSGLRIASPEEYGKIVELRSKIELISIEVRNDAIIPIDDSSLLSMIDDLNQSSLQLMRLQLS